MKHIKLFFFYSKFNSFREILIQNRKILIRHIHIHNHNFLIMLIQQSIINIYLN